MKFLSSRKPFTLFVLSTMLMMLLILTFGLSIYAADNQNVTAARTPKGQILYTQFSLFYEKGHHYTTNYRKGTLLPVNTQVKFDNSDGYIIDVILPDGKSLSIFNVKNFSGEDINSIFNRTFSTKPVDLSSFSEDEKKAIASGKVQPGMSKNAVIVALGYPPKHKTPSLDSDEWRYWQNRLTTFVVHFEKGKVVQIER